MLFYLPLFQTLNFEAEAVKIPIEFLKMERGRVIKMGKDPKAEFEQLYDSNKLRFELFAKGYVRDSAVAEDLVSDSFVYYWENRLRLDADTNAAAYILTTIRHKCLNYLRDLQVHNRVCDELGSLKMRVIEENIRSLERCDVDFLFTNEIREIMTSCLEALPELTRDVFLSRRRDQMSYRQIAVLYSITERRVETELTKATAALRIALKDYLPLSIILLFLDDYLN